MRRGLSGYRSSPALTRPATSRQAVPPAPSPGGVESSIRARLGLHSSSGSTSPPSTRAGSSSSSGGGLPPRAAEARPWESSPSTAASRSLRPASTPAAAAATAASLPSPSAYFERLSGGGGSASSASRPPPSAQPPPTAAVATSVPVAAYLNEVDALRRSMAEAGKEWGATNTLVSKEKDALLAYSRDLEERNRAARAQLAMARICAVVTKATSRRLYSSFTSLRDATVDAAMSSTFALLDKERRSHAELKTLVSGLLAHWRSYCPPLAIHTHTHTRGPSPPSPHPHSPHHHSTLSRPRPLAQCL
jgi:hypothetical protein